MSRYSFRTMVQLLILPALIVLVDIPLAYSVSGHIFIVYEGLHGPVTLPVPAQIMPEIKSIVANHLKLKDGSLRTIIITPVEGEENQLDVHLLHSGGETSEQKERQGDWLASLRYIQADKKYYVVGLDNASQPVGTPAEIALTCEAEEDLNLSLFRMFKDAHLSVDIGHALQRLLATESSEVTEDDELVKRFSELSISPPDKKSLWLSYQKKGEQEKYFKITEDRVALPAATLPDQVIQFPQCLEQIELLQNDRLRSGFLNVLMYAGMAELGAILGPFTVERANSEEAADRDRFIIHITQPEEGIEDNTAISFTLRRSNRRTVEESVWFPDNKYGVTVTLMPSILPETMYCIVAKSDGTEDSFFINKKLTIPKINDDTALRIFVYETLNIPALLSVMAAVSGPFFWGAEQGVQRDISDIIVQRDNIKKQVQVFQVLFTVNISWDKWQWKILLPWVNKDIILDEVVERSSVICYQDSCQKIKTTKVYNLNDKSTGSLYGPFYINTPDGKGQYYCLHLVARPGGKGFIATRIPGYDLKKAWRNQHWKQVTGQYYEKDTVILDVHVNKAGRVAVTLTRNNRQCVSKTDTADEWWRAGYVMDMDAISSSADDTYIPDLGGILDVMASVGSGQLNAPNLSPEALLTFGPVNPQPDVFFSSIFRNETKIPHYHGCITRRPIYLAKKTSRAAGGIARFIWNHPGMILGTGAILAAYVSFQRYPSYLHGIEYIKYTNRDLFWDNEIPLTQHPINISNISSDSKVNN